MLDSIEPGGVRTEWNKDSMIKVPTHPAYTGADAPSTTFRPLINIEYTGDPIKGDISTAILSRFVLTKFVHLGPLVAKALITIAKADDPPMRLLLGADTLHVVRATECFEWSVAHDCSQIRFKCETLLKDAKDWEALSVSISADDHDPEFLSKLGPATRKESNSQI